MHVPQVYQPSFNGCWAKLRRAAEHRNLLDQYARETFAIEANRARVGLRFDRSTSEYVLYVSHMPDLGPFFERVSVILGDAIHDLRSALDHLVFELARWNTNDQVRNPREIQFPIVDTPGDFQKAERNLLAEIRPEHRAIIERYQPYHRIHEQVAVGPYFHPLAMLRDLSNVDKHRLLITVMVPTSGIQDPVGGVAGPAFLVFTAGHLQQVFNFKNIETRPVAMGVEIVRARMDMPVFGEQVDMAAYILPGIALPEEGRSVVGVLDKISAVVSDIIRKF